MKAGYGRNYLVRRPLITWTRGAEKQIATIKRAREVREVRDLGHAQELKSELEGLTVTVAAKAGETGQLFGSVSTRTSLRRSRPPGGPDVDRSRLALDHAIKHTGEHQVSVNLHPGRHRHRRHHCHPADPGSLPAMWSAGWTKSSRDDRGGLVAALVAAAP